MHPAAALWRHARAVAAADAAACTAAPSARALLAARLPAPAARRCYATGADDGVQTVFHTTKKQVQRSAAARRPDARDFDYLRDEVATRLVDRLHDITRSFPVALDLGANTGNVGRQLELTGAGGVQRLYAVEQNRACGRRAAWRAWRAWGGAAAGAGGGPRMVRASPGGDGWCGRRRAAMAGADVAGGPRLVRASPRAIGSGAESARRADRSARHPPVVRRRAARRRHAPCARARTRRE